MARPKKDNGGPASDLTNRKMLRILLQEIADVRRELKEDIAALAQTLTRKMDGVERGLGRRIDALASHFNTLRLEVHQNQTAFMQNHADLERRVEVLETPASA